MNPSPPNPQIRSARLGTSMIFFVCGAAMAIFVTRIPSFRHQLGLTDGQLGIALLGAGAGSLFGFPLAGPACSRFGSKAVTIGASLALCGALATLPSAGSMAGLGGLLAIFGFFTGGMDVAMNAHGVEVEALYGRSIMSSLHGMYSLGGLIGAAIGGLLLKAGVSTATQLGAGAGVLAGLVLFAGAKLLDRPQGSSIDHPAFALPSRAVMGLGILTACAFLCEGAMADWSGVYLRDTLGEGAAFSASGFVAFSIAMVVTRFVGDRILTAYGAVRTLTLGGLVAAGGLTLALVSGNSVAALAGFASVGMGMATVAPIAFGAAGRRKHPPAGIAIASVATMGYSGFLIGPPFIGFLADRISLRLALGVVVVLALLIVALARNAAE